MEYGGGAISFTDWPIIPIRYPYFKKSAFLDKIVCSDWRRLQQSRDGCVGGPVGRRGEGEGGRSAG